MTKKVLNKKPYHKGDSVPLFSEMGLVCPWVPALTNPDWYWAREQLWACENGYAEDLEDADA